MTRLLKVTEVCERLGLSESKVWNLVRANEIPSVKVGKSRRVPEDTLDAYVDSLRPAVTK